MLRGRFSPYNVLERNAVDMPRDLGRGKDGGRIVASSLSRRSPSEPARSPRLPWSGTAFLCTIRGAEEICMTSSGTIPCAGPVEQVFGDGDSGSRGVDSELPNNPRFLASQCAWRMSTEFIREPHVWRLEGLGRRMQEIRTRTIPRLSTISRRNVTAVKCAASLPQPMQPLLGEGSLECKDVGGKINAQISGEKKSNGIQRCDANSAWKGNPKL